MISISLKVSTIEYMCLYVYIEYTKIGSIQSLYTHFSISRHLKTKYIHIIHIVRRRIQLQYNVPLIRIGQGPLPRNTNTSLSIVHFLYCFAQVYMQVSNVYIVILYPQPNVSSSLVSSNDMTTLNKQQAYELAIGITGYSNIL